MKVEIELPDGLHPNTQKLVTEFAAAMGHKLRIAEQKYGYADGWLTEEWRMELPTRLLEHVEKGDPTDVANYCAFAWARRWSTKPYITWTFAERLVRWVYRLCAEDRDVASLLSISSGADGMRDAVVAIRDHPEAASKLRAWLIASNYLDPKRIVNVAQREVRSA